MSRRRTMLAAALPATVALGILSGCGSDETEDASATASAEPTFTATAEPSTSPTPELFFHQPEEVVAEKSGEISGLGQVVLQTYNDGTAEVRLFEAQTGAPAHWSRLDCEEGDLHSYVFNEDGTSLIGSLLVADTTVCRYDGMPIDELYEVIVSSDIFEDDVVSI